MGGLANQYLSMGIKQHWALPNTPWKSEENGSGTADEH